MMLEAQAGSGPLSHTRSFDVVNLWLVLATAVVWLVVLPALQQSMFFDGLIYSSLARNMAFGGSVWEPKFSETMFPLFAEHPPLMMMFESLLFRLFGDHLWVEKLVSAALLIPAALLFRAIWLRLCEGQPDLQALAPVAMLLSLASGKFSWGFANNTLENALTVCCYASVLCSLVAISRQSLGTRLAWLAASALAILAALMVKGPVGLFPLAVIGLHWLTQGRPGFVVAVRDTIILGVMVAAGLMLILSYEPAQAYLARYAEHQLMASLTGNRGHEGGGGHAVWTLLRINLYSIIAAAAIILAARLPAFRREAARAAEPSRTWRRPALFVLALALASSVPILLSPRIYSFYFNPSLPFYAGACTLAAAYPLARILARFSARQVALLRRVYGAALVLSVIAVLVLAGSPGRDAPVIEDADAIAAAACPAGQPCRAILASCGAAGQDWQLHAYLQRRHGISLGIANGAAVSSTAAPYLVAARDCDMKAAAAYVPSGITLNQHSLWRKASP